jgi:hypothetical protein
MVVVTVLVEAVVVVAAVDLGEHEEALASRVSKICPAIPRVDDGCRCVLK